MIDTLRKLPGHWVVALGIILTALLGGCQTGPKYSDLPPEVGDRFHIGDPVTVTFTLMTEDSQLPSFSGRVQDDGTITLPLVGAVTAVGKTEGELQKEIQGLYVPKYYRNLTITVKGEVSFYYIDGEVQARGKKEYPPGQMTIVKAIADAGGFTDFANRTHVRLTRGNHTQIINVEKAIQDPRYDVPVFPGDKIYVKRKIF